MASTKYVIGCQQRKGSLAIAEGVEEGHGPVKTEYEKRVVDLSEAHQKWLERRDTPKAPVDSFDSNIIQDLATVVRPKPKPAK